MNYEKVLFCIEEVINRYDIDENDILEPKEVFCFLQGFFGPGHTTGHVGLIKQLYEDPKYDAKDVIEIREGSFTTLMGNLTIKGMVKFCEDKLIQFKEYQEKAIDGLIAHGYELDGNNDPIVLKEANPTHETYQTLALRVIQMFYNDPLDPYIMTWEMDVGNNMAGFKIRPNEKALELKEKIRGYENSTAYWDNTEARWELKEKLAQIECFTGKTWNPKFTYAVKEIFNKYDIDGDSKLNREEMKLYCAIFEGKFGHSYILEQNLNNNTLELIFQEALANDYELQSLKKFVLWHGYDTDLNLKKGVNKKTLTLDTLITRLLKDIELKKRKGINFELELLSDIVLYSLDHDDEDSLIWKPRKGVLQEIAKSLSLPDLQDIFKLKNGEYQNPKSPEEAIQLLILMFRYVRVDISQSEIKKTSFIRNAEEIVGNYVKNNLSMFVDYLTSHKAIKLLKKSIIVNDHIAFKLCRVFGGVGESIIPEILRSMHEDVNYFSNFWGYFKLKHLIIIALQLSLSVNYGSGTVISVLKRVEDNEIESLLENIVEQKIAPQEFTDYIHCSIFKQSYPAILSREEEICHMTVKQIEEKLSEYIGISKHIINEYFYKNKIITLKQSIGEIILRDATILKKHNVDRIKLVSKFTAAFSLFELNSLKEHLKNVRDYPDFSDNRDQEQILMDLIEIKKQAFNLEFGVDIDNLPRNFPLRVVKLSTSGHHQDVFHPSHSMASYYMENDSVGGADDCMIINIKLLSKDHEKEVRNWTIEQIQNLLNARLNASEKAYWEKWDGILYCSDMNPYLIRVACCFEGLGTRYRVDPSKLCKILELI